MMHLLLGISVEVVSKLVSNQYRPIDLVFEVVTTHKSFHIPTQHQPTNQPTNRICNQPINQPTNRPTNRPATTNQGHQGHDDVDTIPASNNRRRRPTNTQTTRPSATTKTPTTRKEGNPMGRETTAKGKGKQATRETTSQEGYSMG